MKNYLKSFKIELDKLALSGSIMKLGGWGGIAMNAGFGALAISGAAKAGKESASKLGTSAPMELKPISSYNIESGRYTGISPRGLPSLVTGA